jgi:hypothetical protein
VTPAVDADLGLAGSLPVVSDLRDAMVDGMEAVLVDSSGASVESAREPIVGVCDPAN